MLRKSTDTDSPSLSCRNFHRDSDFDRDNFDRQVNTRLQWAKASSDQDATSSRSATDQKEVERQKATPTAEVVKHRQKLKPPKFDGSTASETFIAQFQNCANFNQWNEEEQLAFLRGALEKEAAQVLWDYSPQEVYTTAKLLSKIRQCFGESVHLEKCKLELKSRRRQPGETLQHLHSDIRRLAILAFLELEESVRELVTCDYFFDSLHDPELVLALRGKSGKHIDEV